MNALLHSRLLGEKSIETAIGSVAYGPLEHPFLIVGEQE